jgi:oligopeptide/dipeptide ABC transporter ATP-binding protein
MSTPTGMSAQVGLTTVVGRPVLHVLGLRKEFTIRSRGRHATLTAVDDLNVSIGEGETVALVGESGSGKSTVARCLTRLVEPTAGSMQLDGRSLGDLSWKAMSRSYGDMQMVFQDPNSSLNPRMRVEDILDEPMRLHSRVSAAKRRVRVVELIHEVGLTEVHLSRFPRELSGGQRQRVGIARALAVDPKLIILDEPTSSLDVSVRGQVLALLERIQQERKVAYLFITHDLQVVRKIADRVLVMYLGSVVEEGPTAEVFANPVHPYTRALLSAAPVAEWGRVRNRFELIGEIPSPVDLPPGCRLAGRCPIAQPECRVSRPPLLKVPTTGVPLDDDPLHSAACPPSIAALNELIRAADSTAPTAPADLPAPTAPTTDHS